MQTEKSRIFLQMIPILSKKPLSIKTHTLLNREPDKTLSLICQFISFQLNLDEEGFLTIKESKRAHFAKYSILTRIPFHGSL